MLSHFAITLIQASHASRKVSHFFLQLGGVGLIPLGLLDSSIIPLPGSMDIVTIVLAAHDQSLWVYYAVMATVGSVVGAYFTFRLARHQGENHLAKRVSRKKMKKFSQAFSRWGFGAIAVPALMPPPMPMVPFVLAAGASKYSLKRFVLAMGLGRLVRYSVLAFLGAHYGRHIVRLFSEYGVRILYVTIALVCGAVIFELIRRFTHKPEPQS